MDLLYPVCTHRYAPAHNTCHVRSIQLYNNNNQMNSNFIQHGYIARTPIHTLSLSLSLYVSLSLFSPMYTLSLSLAVFFLFCILKQIG